MLRFTRRRPALAVAALLTGCLAFAFVPAALAGEMNDPQGDTINDDTDQPMDVPEADITKSWIAVDSRTIRLGLQVRKPTDPAKNRAWVDGDTSAEWDLDVNGDSAPDFTASLSNDDGQVSGGVSRFDAAEEDEDVCDVSRYDYSADSGYTMTVDAACVGSPAKVAYQAEFFYDTEPGNESAPEAADSSPDDGMAPAG